MKLCNIPKQGYLAPDLMTAHNPAHTTVLGLHFHHPVFSLAGTLGDLQLSEGMHFASSSELAAHHHQDRTSDTE